MQGPDEFSHLKISMDAHGGNALAIQAEWSWINLEENLINFWFFKLIHTGKIADCGVFNQSDQLSWRKCWSSMHWMQTTIPRSETTIK